MRFFKRTWERLRHAYQNRHEPECVHVLADAYWRILLLTTALIVFVAVWYGFWQLMTITSGSAASSPVSTSAAPPILDREALESTVNGFSERRARYEFLIDNPPKVSDPSR